MPSILPLHSKGEDLARPVTRPVPTRGLSRRHSATNRSIFGNLLVLESFARNDGQHGQLNHDKMEKVAALESSPRRNSGLLHASSNFLASLRGAGVTAQARNSSSHNLGTASNDKKIKDESWIVQMNRVMGNQSPLTAHRKKCHSPHRESTDETLKGQIINKLNVVLNTSSGIAKSQSSGQFKVQTGGGLATKTMNISNLGEFESIDLADRLFELYLFFKRDAHEALSVWSVEFPAMMKMLNKYKWVRVMLETILDNQATKDWQTNFSQTLKSFNSKHGPGAKDRSKRGERSIDKELSVGKQNSGAGIEMSAEKFKEMRIKTMNKKGAKFGSLLLRGCLFNGSVPAAVDEWILQNEPIRRMDEKFHFFRRFIGGLLYHVQGSSRTLKVRLAMGVVFTYIDQVSDFIVMIDYYRNPGSFYSFMAMLIIFILHILQDIFWIVMLKRQNFESMRRDIWLRIFFIKPIYDLYKIFLDHPTDHGCMIDPLQEFVDTKQVEVIWECIPQSIIQGLALLVTPQNRSSQIVSLLITVISTGFNQAVCSLITDTDPKKRQKDSNTRGFVPNTATERAITFTTLTIFITIYSALRVGAYLIFIQTVGSVSAVAFFLEFVFLLTIKYLTSGDFFCWWPVSGVFAFFLAFWVRLQAHIVTNFAPFTEHRLPINSGGLFWIMSIVWSITSNFIYIYASYQFSDLCLEELKLNTCTPIEMSTMLSIYALGALVCLFILLLFFLSIKKSHWGTFFSTESSKQYNIRTCWQSKEDSLKCEALLKHASFRPDAEDVRKWMEENWLEWEEENPSWFHHYRKTLLYVLEPNYLPSASTLAEGESTMNARLIREEEQYWEEQRKLQADEDSDEDDLGKTKSWTESVRSRIRRASEAILSAPDGGNSAPNTFRGGTKSLRGSRRGSSARRPSAMAVPPPRPVPGGSPGTKGRRATVAARPQMNTTSLGAKLDTMKDRQKKESREKPSRIKPTSSVNVIN